METKCSPQAMLKIIRRNMESSAEHLLPEHHLILAVIGGALSDLLDKNHRRSAVAFFNHEIFDRYCDLLGLSPVATRQIIGRGGFCFARGQ